MKSDATTEMAFFVLLAKLGSLSATAREDDFERQSTVKAAAGGRTRTRH